ncbi:MAG: DUF3606 domain-containing protein [Candidatus Dadabacteria bacterium]
MADNKDLRSSQDRSRVAGNEEYELRYMAEKMGVSTDEIRKAIEEVGNDRSKLEDYFKNKGRR